MKILFLSILSASAILLGGAEFSLKHNQSGKFRFNAPGKKQSVLFFRARIKVPTPLESWGTNALQIKLNGKSIGLPINKEKNLINPQVRPQTASPVLDKNGYFVKADSDWIVFNAGNRNDYRNTWNLNQVNSTELSNVFYTFAFKLENLKKSGNTIEFKAVLPPELAKYKLEISGVEVRGFDDRIIFSRDWLQAIYPWSFPSARELEIPEVSIARNEHGFAAFSIYCFKEQEFKLPENVQCYRLDNSNIPAKLKEAQDRHIPNIGKPYVPELFTPLVPGSTLKLPAGTTTLAVRFKNSVPGSYQFANIPVKFKVLDITLPEANDLPVQNTMYIMSSGTDTRNIYPEFHEYGMTMMLMSPWAAGIPLKIVDDKLVADFSKFDARIKMFQDMGMNKKCLFYGTSEPILRNISKLTGEKEEGANFQRRFKEFIVLFANHADELGIPIYISLYDEANFQKNVWGKTKLLTKVATTVPNSRLWSTVTELASAAHYYEELGYRRDRDMCITHPFQTFEKADDEISKGVLSPAKKIKDLRKRFFGEYDGITSYPGNDNRYAFGVRAWHSELKYMMGFAFWWGNMRKENVVPTKRYYVCYPFREAKTQQRYSSVGWEAIRTGIDDMRYLTMAKQILTKKSGKASAEKTLQKIVGIPQYSAKNIQYCQFNKIRKELVKIIMEKK